MPFRPRSNRRHRRNLRRLSALGGIAAAAFLAGLVTGARHEPAARRLAADWAQAWVRSDYGAMHAMITPEAQRATPLRAFVAAYRRAATTATLDRLDVGEPRLDGDDAVLHADARTRIFGDVAADVVLPIGADETGQPRVDWNAGLVFPGLRPGEKLTRQTTLPPRATIEARDGAVLAMAGIATSAPQPPGSVFKIVTLSAALQAHATKPTATFPVQTSATLSGVELQNAHGEACGGSLINAFAVSCNSVFAPLGVQVGARRLVAAAERFGFNADPGIAGAARATIPAAAEIGDDLALGSTAIGQGKVLATPLTMALAAAAIAEHGRRPLPTLLHGDRRGSVQATTPHVARLVARAMRAVVTQGTGAGAAIAGVEVAGKTGTAELRSTVNQTPQATDPAQPPPAEDPTDTDAWFAAFAPMRHPKIAVCVLLVAQGAGGDTAAPAARVVLQAGL
jgi:hypothetical protein